MPRGVTGGDVFSCGHAYSDGYDDSHRQEQDSTRPPQVEWDLSEIYPSEEAWTAEKERLEVEVQRLTNYRGRLGESAAVFREGLDAISAADKVLSRLYVYAFLKADEDRRIAVHQERRGLAAAFRSAFDEATSFVAPELLRVGSGTVERYLADDPGLTKHAFNVRNILRQEPHTLSDEAERVIAATGPALQGPERIYAMLSSSDLPFPTVTLSTGEHVRLDQVAYTKHRASQNREDRRLVFDTFWGAWRAYETTMGQILDTHVKTHAFESRARGYESALEAALAGPNIPTVVYATLISATHRHLPSLHRYFRLRQRMLGLDDLHYYDIYPSVVASDRTFDLDESKQLTLASARPLGPDYADLLEQGFGGRWMHVFPPAREGTWRLHVRVRLRRAPVPLAQLQRPVERCVDVRLRVGACGAHVACNTAQPIRNGRVRNLYDGDRLDDQRGAAARSHAIRGHLR